MTQAPRMRFNPPPNWPAAPTGWTPGPDWAPDPSWGPAPVGWSLWIPEQSRSWFARHKVLTGVGGGFVALFLLCGVIGAVSGGSSNHNAVPSAQTGQVAVSKAPDAAASKAAADAAASKAAADAAASKAAADAAASKAAADAAASKAAADKAAAAPAETVSQANAREKAASYLSFSAFSRTGLIKQLEFDGFSSQDATYGVDKQNADWNAEAVAKAKDYLSFTSFSHSGLVGQLEFDGFTAAQAEYGVSHNGL